MSLANGTRLGAYEVLSPIGAGGMGEVYRARDTRLNREVAIRVSAERFSERFEQIMVTRRSSILPRTANVWL